MKSKIKTLLLKIIPSKLHPYIKYWSFVRNHSFTYEQDGLYSMMRVDFLSEPRFLESYGMAKKLTMPSWGDFNFQWRAYIACWAASYAATLPGEFVECGVNTGMLTRMVINYINFATLNKKFYLLDTFEGLSEKYSTAREMEASRQMKYHDIFEEVTQTFKKFPNVKLVRGAVPETLKKLPEIKVAYLSIDMNCVYPEVSALEFFWDKMVSGGVILLDDYGFDAAQHKAQNEFARSKNVLILPVATGQGIIIKT